jgi:hypothetical protein
MATREEAEKLLGDLVAAKLAFDEQWEQLRVLTGIAADSPFGCAAWAPVELLINCVAKLVGDDCGSVHWFIWDNDCGDKGMEHSLRDGEMRLVCGVDDLLDVLGY